MVPPQTGLRGQKENIRHRVNPDNCCFPSPQGKADRIVKSVSSLRGAGPLRAGGCASAVSPDFAGIKDPFRVIIQAILFRGGRAVSQISLISLFAGDWAMASLIPSSASDNTPNSLDWATGILSTPL